ncbi:MAG: hypothetical protein RLZZ200_187 [Pseudomonadota bacterium]
MPRRALSVLLLAGAAFGCAVPATAQAACTRASLMSAVDRYLAAQGMGDPDSLPLAPRATYAEQGQSADLRKGILAQVLKVDYHHTLVDVKQCETFTELAVTNPTHPYVIGTHLKVDDDVITSIDSLVTDADDWLFSAGNFMKHAIQDDWNVIDREHRRGREEMIAAANAYLDYFSDKTIQVPWGTPCRRLEGGLVTGKGAADDSCNVDVPDGVPIVDRRFVVDESRGAIAALVRFGRNRLPDAHLFRIVNGRIRAIHTLTVCKTFNCGFPVPEALK